MPSCHRQVHADSKTCSIKILQFLDCGFRLTRFVLYNGRKTVVVVVVAYYLLTYLFAYYWLQKVNAGFVEVTSEEHRCMK